MHLRVSIVAALALAACVDPDPATDSLTAPLAPEDVDVDDDDVVAGELIVKLRGPLKTRRLVAGGSVYELVRLIGPDTWLMRRAARGFQLHDDPAAAIAAIALLPEVEYVHDNALIPFSRVPNDPLYGVQQWNYDAALRLPRAWDVTTGTSAVRIGVIDSGRTEHPDLTWAEGVDFVDGDLDPTATGTYHHGAHVAGILAARDNEIGGVGVCWNCTLVPLRTSLGSNSPAGAIAEALNWAGGMIVTPEGGVDGPRRVDVVNLSMNSAVFRCNSNRASSVRRAIQYATLHGVAVVVSAGNFARATGPAFPGDCVDAIAVAASQPDGALAPYSNRGSGIDLVAPGGGHNNDVEIDGYRWEAFGAEAGSWCPRYLSGSTAGDDPYLGPHGVVSTFTAWTATPQPFDQCYRHLSGTSMAAPHVTGVIGLMRSLDPSLTPEQLLQYLKATARPGAMSCPVAGQCGAGLIDAYAAVRAARDGLHPTPDLDVGPTALGFPPTRVTTTSAPLGLAVRNLETGTLSATITAASPQLAVSCNGGASYAAACSVAVGGGLEAVVLVRYAPTASGGFASSLTVTSASPAESIVVPVTGTATIGRVRFSPSALELGSVRVGEAAEQTIQLLNTGTAAVTIAPIGPQPADGAHYRVTSVAALPTTIAPGASTTFTIRCQPTTPGRKTFALTIAHDASTQDPMEVDIGCDATAPHASITEADGGSFDFGAQSIHTTETRTMLVKNQSGGATTLTFSLTRPAAPFALSCVSRCSCTASACTGSIASGGNPAVLVLGYTPTTATSHSAALGFSSNAFNLPTTTITTSGVGALP